MTDNEKDIMREALEKELTKQKNRIAELDKILKGRCDHISKAQIRAHKKERLHKKRFRNEIIRKLQLLDNNPLTK